MKQLRVTVTIRNNQLLERREQMGMSQIDLAEAVGISVMSYQELERCDVSPFRLRDRRPPRCLRSGCSRPNSMGYGCRDHLGSISPEVIEAWKKSVPLVFRDVALKLAAFHGVDAEELFDAQLHSLNANRVEKTMEIEEVVALALTGPREIPCLSDGNPEEEEVALVPDLLAALTEKESLVINQRYGLTGSGDGHGLALDEVALQLGVSSERIRQIEAKALRKLRDAARRREAEDNRTVRR